MMSYLLSTQVSYYTPGTSGYEQETKVKQDNGDSSMRRSAFVPFSQESTKLGSNAGRDESEVTGQHEAEYLRGVATLNRSSDA